MLELRSARETKRECVHVSLLQKREGEERVECVWSLVQGTWEAVGGT